MDILKLVEAELTAFRQSGRPIHLAHAARALREACDELKQSRTTGNVDVIKTAGNDWLRHHDARLGAALAYYSVFSRGPLLLIVESIAGVFFGPDAVREALTGQFRSLLGPVGSQAVEAMVKGASSPGDRRRWPGNAELCV